MTMSAKKARKTSTKGSRATGRKRTRAQGRWYRAAYAVAAGSGRSVKERIAALTTLGRTVCDDNEKFQGVLNILRDTATPIAVRLAALRTLQAASFSAASFSARRPDYLKTLRSVASDPDRELRQRALGLLSREQDGHAQRLLLEGLKDPKKALVPPEKALQLLSYDVHADAYPAAREIIRKPPSPAAKREALRLLAADAASAPVFEKILRDKNEPVEIRQLSASALHSLAPRRLQAHARAIVLDKAESNELKATSLTALTQFGEPEAMAKDKALNRRVDRLRARGGSAGLKRTARSFLTKYTPRSAQ
jgi:uncharacterized protein (UPF0147 family)